MKVLILVTCLNWIYHKEVKRSFHLISYRLKTNGYKSARSIFNRTRVVRGELVNYTALLHTLLTALMRKEFKIYHESVGMCRKALAFACWFNRKWHSDRSVL